MRSNEESILLNGSCFVDLVLKKKKTKSKQKQPSICTAFVILMEVVSYSEQSHCRALAWGSSPALWNHSMVKLFQEVRHFTEANFVLAKFQILFVFPPGLIVQPLFLFNQHPLAGMVHYAIPFKVLLPQWEIYLKSSAEGVWKINQIDIKQYTCCILLFHLYTLSL